MTLPAPVFQALLARIVLEKSMNVIPILVSTGGSARTETTLSPAPVFLDTRAPCAR